MTANVALVGALQSGKDSVAAYLIAEKGYTRFSFADALKNEVVTALNAVDTPYVPGTLGWRWTRELVEQHKEFLRPFLHWYGTEYRRAQNDLYWVKQTMDAIKRWPGRATGMRPEEHQDLPIVFTDARFTNELIAVQGLDCKIVELDMPEIEVRARLIAKGITKEEIDSKLAHLSEREWRPFPKDAVFTSTAGNLPLLATHVLDFLETGKPCNQDYCGMSVRKSAVEFFATLYPHLYDVPKKRSHKKKAT